MRRLRTAYWLTVLLWFAYALACGLSYGRPVALTADTLTPAVRPGEMVAVRYHIVRYQLCEVTRYPAILDGAGRLHEFGPERRAAVGPIGRPDGYTIQRRVPPDAAPGLARYRLALAFECPLEAFGLKVPNLFHQVTPNTLVLEDVLFWIEAPA